MEFSKSGWLLKYIAFRKENPFPEKLPTTGLRVVEGETVHHLLDEAIYYFLQPTGIFYGFPVGAPYPNQKYPNFEFMANQDKVYLIYLETMFSCLVADRNYLLEGMDLMEDHFQSAVEVAKNFHLLRYPEGTVTRFLRKKVGLKGNQDLRMEKVLQTHLGRKRDLVSLSGDYHNSFLFLEIYGSMLWQRRMLLDAENAKLHEVELLRMQLVYREVMVRLMIAAAWSGGAVEDGERRLIEWFLRSSDLPPLWQKNLRKEMITGISLEEIKFPEAPWLVRRFMLEAILVVILVDQDLSQGEERFLKVVVEKLDLWEGELNQSLTAIEVFMLNHQGDLNFFNDRSTLWNVQDNLRNRAQMILSKNIQRIETEVRETKELYALLMKSTKENLNHEEKQKVRSQLMDILKTIPALTIFVLPGGSLVLPILIKLLPFNLLPSSFED